MSFERELGLEGGLAAEDVTDEKLLILLVDFWDYSRTFHRACLDERTACILWSTCVHFDDCFEN